MNLKPQIFKAYDVRGIYPDELDAQGAGQIVHALVAHLRTSQETRTVMLAQDMRPSSLEIAAEVSRALTDEGLHVYDIGFATTPLFYFAINHFRADGGIMVTASHNPAQFNGLKLMAKGAEAVAGEDLKAAAIQGIAGRSATKGTIEKKDALLPYIQFLENHAGPIGTYSLAIDCGNGMGGLVLEVMLPQFPQLSVERLCFERDGRFPNHEANPIKDETLHDLVKVVKSKKIDLGVAFDGDADRVRFVTAKGEILLNDYIAALLVREMLEEKKDGVVVHTVTASRDLKDIVRAGGGIPVRARVGHKFIRAAMQNHHAIFGAEQSGHFYWPELNFRESGVYTMLRLLALLTRHGQGLDSLIQDIRKHVQSGELNFEVFDKQKILTRVQDVYKTAAQDSLDGLTVEYDDWWFNLRPSNTEDLVRLNIEAASPRLLEEKTNELRKLIENN